MTTIPEFISKCGIEEVVHFTTHAGILGILDTRSLLPNAELKKEKRLEFILKLNNEQRKDPKFAVYNSMSITEPNRKFFEFSRNRHGKTGELWWCVLAFSPAIMEYPGVLFCSGNNTWPNTRREQGVNGLAGMFADPVPSTYDRWQARPPSRAPNVPTSLEAEFLYPGRISLEFLLRVYFECQDNADEFVAYARTLGVSLPDGCAVVNPLVFPP